MTISLAADTEVAALHVAALGDRYATTLQLPIGELSSSLVACPRGGFLGTMSCIGPALLYGMGVCSSCDCRSWLRDSVVLPIQRLPYLQREEARGLDGSSPGWRGAGEEAGDDGVPSDGPPAVQRDLCVRSGTGGLLGLQDATVW